MGQKRIRNDCSKVTELNDLSWIQQVVGSKHLPKKRMCLFRALGPSLQSVKAGCSVDSVSMPAKSKRAMFALWSDSKKIF